MKRSNALFLVLVFCVSFCWASGSDERTGEQKLVIYSAASKSETRDIANAFSDKYPDIEVSYICEGSGRIVDRVNREWPHPGGDVVLMMGFENLNRIYELLQPNLSASHDDFKADERDSREDIPRYYGTSLPLQVLMYNTNLITSDDIPTCWKDLADPRFHGKVVLANPSLSGSAYAQLYMMKMLYGMEFVKAIFDNGTRVVASSHSASDAVARGEYMITVTGEANAVMRMKAGAPVSYLFPEEGTGFRMDGSAVLKRCVNQEEGRLFLDFITSPEGFDIVKRKCHRRPAGSESMRSDEVFFKYDIDHAISERDLLVTEFLTYQ